MTPTPELTRAGIVEVAPGVFERPNAKRTIPQAPAAGARTDRDTRAAIEEAQDAPEVSELPHSIEEEQQDYTDGVEGASVEVPDDNCEAGNSGMDREGRAAFRITVALKVSNYGRRDPTGAIETICDLITATRRRLGERLAARQLDGRIGRARTRRGRNHHRKTVEKLPLPF